MAIPREVNKEMLSYWGRAQLVTATARKQTDPAETERERSLARSRLAREASTGELWGAFSPSCALRARDGSRSGGSAEMGRWGRAQLVTAANLRAGGEVRPSWIPA